MQGACSLSIDRSLPLVCISSLLSFFCGVGIGANDLSASFAMVVGSGSLSMCRAIIYCTFFELLGATFMGGRVSKMVRGGIINPAMFAENKDMVLIGMTSASFSAALWLYLSTVFGLPVSITHTVVGSIIGFAFFTTGSFKEVQMLGLVKIVVSWLASPFLSAVLTAAIFYLLRTYILDVEGRSFQNVLRSVPYCLAFSLLTILMFIVIEKPPFFAVTIARFMPLWVQYIVILLAIFFACQLFVVFLLPRLVMEAKRQSAVLLQTVGSSGSSTDTAHATTPGKENSLKPPAQSKETFGLLPKSHQSFFGHRCEGGDESRGLRTTAAAAATYGALSEEKAETPGINFGADDELTGDDYKVGCAVPPINFNGCVVKLFDPQAEYIYTGLQVVAGGVSSFVHGAVAGVNATAAFLILYEVFMRSEFGEDSCSTGWVLLPAFLGIALGMLTLGGRLMKTVGTDLVALTPARGWCIQVGGTFVTMLLTAVGIPVSLTQGQVGAAVGCGLLDAQLNGVSWGTVAKIVCGWAVTLLVAGVTTGLCMWLLFFFYCV